MLNKQEIWDSALLRAWHMDVRLWRLYTMFISELRLLGEPDVPSKKGDIFRYMLSVPLLRKAAVTGIGTECLSPKKPVRAFIAEQMPWLSDRLWDGKLSDAELILKMQEAGYSIEKKSREVKQKINKARNEHQRRKRNYIRERYVHAPSWSNWDTVKGVRSIKRGGRMK